MIWKEIQDINFELLCDKVLKKNMTLERFLK